MDSRTVVIVLLVALVAVLVMLTAWWYATRVKRELDAGTPSFTRASAVVEVTPASVEQLRQLSTEPILLKQAPEGIRVQIDQRPMLPLQAFTALQASSALTETAVAVTQRFGAKWVVLVSATKDGRVTVRRIA